MCPASTMITLRSEVWGGGLYGHYDESGSVQQA
jgi:hypothetical protein